MNPVALALAVAAAQAPAAGQHIPFSPSGIEGPLRPRLVAQDELRARLALPSFRLHVLAGEDLDPDRLRPLAREGVTLWLTTRSNQLRESTVETLARFPVAWVQLRAPFTAWQARALERAPRAGVVLGDADLAGPGLHRLGPRPIAVRLFGELGDGQLDRVRAARPTLVDWEPKGAVDLMAFARLMQLPGRRLVRAEPGQAVGSDAGVCQPGSWPVGAAFWLDARPAGFVTPLFCSRGLRARVQPRISDESLLRLYQADSAVELEVEVGQDEQLASEALLLVRRLVAACQ